MSSTSCSAPAPFRFVRVVAGTVLCLVSCTGQAGPPPLIAPERVEVLCYHSLFGALLGCQGVARCCARECAQRVCCAR